MGRLNYEFNPQRLSGICHHPSQLTPTNYTNPLHVFQFHRFKTNIFLF
jgi:hypothetical protein